MVLKQSGAQTRAVLMFHIQSQVVRLFDNQLEFSSPRALSELSSLKCVLSKYLGIRVSSCCQSAECMDGP